MHAVEFNDEETVAAELAELVDRVVPPGVDIDELIRVLSIEVAVWMAEAYEEGLADGRRRAAVHV